MGNTSWKNFEREVAKFFGGQRNPLSGGHSKHTRGDIIHPELYGENKYSQMVPLWREYNKLRKRKGAEKKIPYIWITQIEPNILRSHWLLVINSKHLTAMAHIYNTEIKDLGVGKIIAEEKYSVCQLYWDSKQKATVEKKFIAYIALKQARAPGWLLVFDPVDIFTLTNYHMNAQRKEPKNGPQEKEVQETQSIPNERPGG